MSQGGGTGEFLVDDLVGRAIGNHRVLSLLGQGGMGAVYLAEHDVLRRKAAIKVLLPEFSNNAGLVARFLNEARATAQLRHPAFVEIFDSGTLPDGSAYLVMEYLRGEDLGQRIRRTGPLPLGDCLLIARAVADGAGFAHRHHIIHRDLKPDNVFLTTGGGEGAQASSVSIKVLDFGIAKLSDPGGGRSSSRTGTGVLLGTPLYMSPEQCRGSGKVDHRSDIYSLGCIIYAMLVGTPPFYLEGFGEIIAAHLGQQPLPLGYARPEIPPSVEVFVASLLSKSPEHRPPDMDRVVAAIDGLRVDLNLPDHVTVPVPTGPVNRTGETSRPRTIAATTPLPPSLIAPPLGSSPPGSSAGSTRRLAAAEAEAAVPPSRQPGKYSGSVSTLAGAVGAVGRDDPWAPPPARPRRVGWMAAGALVVVAAVGGAYAWRLNDSRGREPERESGNNATPANPQHPATLPPEPTSLMAIETGGPAARAGRTSAKTDSKSDSKSDSPANPTDEPQPGGAAPRDMVLHIVSTPPGAELSDAASGEVLGQTPFQGRFARDSRTLTVRVRKPGYRGKDLQVGLNQDRDFKVVLRKPAAEKSAAPSEDLRKL